MRDNVNSEFADECVMICSKTYALKSNHADVTKTNNSNIKTKIMGKGIAKWMIDDTEES